MPSRLCSPSHHPGLRSQVACISKLRKDLPVYDILRAHEHFVLLLQLLGTTIASSHWTRVMLNTATDQSSFSREHKGIDVAQKSLRDVADSSQRTAACLFQHSANLRFQWHSRFRLHHGSDGQLRCIKCAAPLKEARLSRDCCKLVNRSRINGPGVTTMAEAKGFEATLHYYI